MAESVDGAHETGLVWRSPQLLRHPIHDMRSDLFDLVDGDFTEFIIDEVA